MNHKATEHAKKPSNTKSGPGRYHSQGDGLHLNLTLKQRKAGSYGKGLRNWITNKQAAAAA
jgi:hypothetical protein